MKTIYLIIAAALLGSGAMLAMKSCGRKQMKQVQNISIHKDDSSRHYRDLWQTEHANNLLLQGDRKVIEALYNNRVDSLCKRLDIKEKQLQGMASMLAAVKGSFVAPAKRDTMTIHDTLRTGLSFEWNDAYLHEKGFVDSTIAYVTYNIEVPINMATYWKRRWFLGRKRYFIDGYSDNPNVHLSGLTGVKIN